MSYRIEISRDNGETWENAYPGATAMSREDADAMLRAAAEPGATVRIREVEFPL